MTDTGTAAPPVATRRPRNGLGIAGLVLVLVAIGAPLVLWLVVGIVAAIGGGDLDQLVWEGGIGGGILAIGLASLLAPVAVVGVALGIASLFRRDRAKTAGILAICLGILPSLFLAGLPVVLGEFL